MEKTVTRQLYGLATAEVFGYIYFTYIGEEKRMTVYLDHKYRLLSVRLLHEQDSSTKPTWPCMTTLSCRLDLSLLNRLYLVLVFLSLYHGNLSYSVFPVCTLETSTLPSIDRYPSFVSFHQINQSRCL